MSNELLHKFSKVILLAQQKYNESWVEENDYGHYTKGEEECWQEAVKEVELPEELWYVLKLANHWNNDLQAWAEHIRDNGNLNGFFMEPVSGIEIIMPEKEK